MTRTSTVRHLDRPLEAVVAANSQRHPHTGDRLRIAERLVSLVAPASFAADQYRGLRHTVERLRRESDLQVLAVTSPGPGDGKSVTTLNLAGALAQSPDARILVIDADLRKPSVGEYLGLGTHRSPGLADALADRTLDLARIARRIDGFNLWAVPAGAPQRSPYELLNSPRLEALLAEARRQYDCVLVDTPPFITLPDCRVIERSVDGFFIVVAAHRTPRKMLAEVMTLLQPSKLLGVVFNADDRPGSDYYGYSGYYGSQATGHPVWWQRLKDTLRGTGSR